jgi:hypothetical protein
MTALSFNKVTALPGTLVNSAIYYVTGSAGVVEEIVTSTTGTTRQVAPVSSVAPPLTTATTSTAGASDVRARADHSHGLAAIPATTTATTQTAGDSSTLVATTAFVTAAVAAVGAIWTTEAW